GRKHEGGEDEPQHLAARTMLRSPILHLQGRIVRGVGPQRVIGRAVCLRRRSTASAVTSSEMLASVASTASGEASFPGGGEPRSAKRFAAGGVVCSYLSDLVGAAFVIHVGSSRTGVSMYIAPTCRPRAGRRYRRVATISAASAERLGVARPLR